MCYIKEFELISGSFEITSWIFTLEIRLVEIWRRILEGVSLEAGGSAFSKEAIRIQEIIRVLELKK